MRRTTMVEKEFDKNSKSHDNLRSKVSELSREVTSRLSEVGKNIAELNDLKMCIEDIRELKEGISEIKSMLSGNLHPKQDV